MKNRKGSWSLLRCGIYHKSKPNSDEFCLNCELFFSYSHSSFFSLKQNVKSKMDLGLDFQNGLWDHVLASPSHLQILWAFIWPKFCLKTVFNLGVNFLHIKYHDSSPITRIKVEIVEIQRCMAWSLHS